MSDLLIQVSRRAMACEFEARFPADRCPLGTQLALEALDAVEALDAQLSYFRPASEISRINLLAAEEPVEASPELFELLELAVQIHRETGGAYDITSVPLWEAWGFARRAGQVPTEAELSEARALVGGHLVELDPARQTVRFRKPGVRINLGSIGKGYALDVCGRRLTASGMVDFLLHGGQSSVLAHGRSVDSPDGRSTVPWEVGVCNPQRPKDRLGVIRLDDRALGTSGGQFQSFRHRGHRYGHILDPRTGRPAEGVLSATVVAPTAALADALSTAFYVLGPEGALEYCRSRPELSLVMVCPDGRGSGVSLHISDPGGTFRSTR
ncbi:MAG: FAD:protein FMN transferase [Thermoguttaceae bacterium]